MLIAAPGSDERGLPLPTLDHISRLDTPCRLLQHTRASILFARRFLIIIHVTISVNIGTLSLDRVPHIGFLCGCVVLIYHLSWPDVSGLRHLFRKLSVNCSWLLKHRRLDLLLRAQILVSRTFLSFRLLGESER